MSTPFGGPARTAPGLPNLPTPPTGWPVGSYATYAEAQRAVDYLADSDFSGSNAFGPILVGLISGVLFGVVFAAVGYGATHGRRDFTSASQMVAGRYDVLCQPRNAEKARELLAKLAMGPGTAADTPQQ